MNWLPVTIRVYGRPAPQGSKTYLGQGADGKHHAKESSKYLKPWRDTVILTSKRLIGPGWVPLDCALRVDHDFFLERPQKTKYPDRPASPPDKDKLVRAVEDGLTQAGVITDDARIVEGLDRKLWATETEPPGVKITISLPGPILEEIQRAELNKNN